MGSRQLRSAGRSPPRAERAPSRRPPGPWLPRSQSPTPRPARGKTVSPDRLTGLVSDYVKRSGVGKPGACHLSRHTMATLMLEGGADIRFIQQMLAHADISTTQIYTQVSLRQLRAIHAATHPAAQNTSRRHRPSADGVDDGESAGLRVTG
ncbi:MAG: tyrosine-type recombinase/integrase [Solirubrobacteraceae bacterium]